MLHKPENEGKEKKFSIFSRQYMRFSLLFLLPCFISVVAICFSLSYNFISNKKSISAQAQMQLKSQASACEADIKAATNVLKLYASQKPFCDILYNEDMTPAVSDAAQSIEKIKKSYPLIDSIIIYSQKTNTIFWKDSLYPSDDFYANTVSYSLYNTAYWKSFRLSNATMTRTLLPTSVSYDGQEKMVLPVVTKKSVSDEFSNFLIINFDLDYIMGVPFEQKISENTETYIFNRYNNTLIKSPQNPNNLNCSEDFIGKLLGNNNDYFTYKFDNRKYLISSFSNTSSLMGYTYFNVTPYRDIWALIFSTLIINVLACIIIIIIALGAALFNARRTTMPIHEIFTTVLKHEPRSKKNIIADLKESTLSIAEEHSHLMNILPVAQAKFLIDFLNDRTDYTTEESATSILRDSLTFKHSNYAVVIMQIVFKSSLYDVFSVSDCAGLEKSLQTFVKNLFSENFDTLVLQDEKKSLCIILNSENTDGDSVISDTINTILSALSTDINNLNIQLGKSKFYPDTDGLKKAYKEACFSFAPVTLTSDMQLSDQVIDSEIRYNFLKTDETEMFNALVKLDIDKVLEIINNILDRNVHINTRSKQQLYYLILNIILKVLHIKKIPYRQTMLDFEVYNSILNLPPAEIQKQISSMLSYMQNYVKTNPEKYTPVTDSKKIIEYIRINYTDPFISLDTLAEQFDMTGSKISLIIKKELGIGFHNYLTKLRLDEAKRLLTTDDISIKEISLKCGFGSEKTFFRIFKNNTGITPSAFRKNHNKKNET